MNSSPSARRRHCSCTARPPRPCCLSSPPPNRDDSGGSNASYPPPKPSSPVHQHSSHRRTRPLGQDRMPRMPPWRHRRHARHESSTQTQADRSHGAFSDHRDGETGRGVQWRVGGGLSAKKSGCPLWHHRPVLAGSFTFRVSSITYSTEIRRIPLTGK